MKQIDRYDLHNLIVQKATEWIGTDKSEKFAREMMQDIDHLSNTGEIPPSVGMAMSFGTFEGVQIQNCPRNYLNWLSNQDFMQQPKFSDLLYEINALLSYEDFLRSQGETNKQLHSTKKTNG